VKVSRAKVQQPSQGVLSHECQDFRAGAGKLALSIRGSDYTFRLPKQV